MECKQSNSVDPDQTAPRLLWVSTVCLRGAVLSGTPLFDKAYLSENIGSLQ